MRESHQISEKKSAGQHRFSPQTVHGYQQSIAEQIGYSRNSKLVIIHADDIAMSKDSTDASLQAMDSGMVKSGSIMVPCPDIERTIAIWKENPDIDLGIHLTLTCEWGAKHPWSPVLPRNEVPSLYNSDGCMWPNYLSLSKHMKTREALMEMETQIKRVLQEGLNPTHLDAHMGIYLANKDLYKGVLNLSKKYMMPARVSGTKRYRMPFLLANNLMELKKKGYVFPETYKGYKTIPEEETDYTLRLRYYKKYLADLKPGVNEVITHMCHHTKESQDIFGNLISMQRSIEFDIWTSQAIKKYADSLKISFIGFKYLCKLLKKKWSC